MFKLNKSDWGIIGIGFLILLVSLLILYGTGRL
jgi:hypothetical protein